MIEASVASGASRPAPSVVRRLPSRTDAACVYLTFDDGPDATSTPRVLAALAAADIRASFFVIGRLASRHGALLREMRSLGHAIGNHSYSHRHPWTLPPAAAHREVRDGAAAIADALGEQPGWYRPPHGRLGPFGAAAARAAGQRVALWSRSAVDWGPLATPRSILGRLRGLGAGEIVLMHDGPLRHNRPDHTLQALPTLLRELAAHGFEAVPLPPAGTMAG